MSREPSDGRIVTDHLGRHVMLKSYPERIISLCPSLTETLFVLGLAERVVGRTRHCVHPHESVKRARSVGGTKDVREDIIATLEPDLIFCEKEENTKAMVDALSRVHPVYVVDVHTVEDAITMVKDLGVVTGAQLAAGQLVQEICTQLDRLQVEATYSTAYLIWKDPYMAAGEDTYLDDLLRRAGFLNVFRQPLGRYPEVTLAQLMEIRPEVVFLSSEPYPFGLHHQIELQGLLPDSYVMLIDGEICWSGARMRQACSVLLAAQAALQNRVKR